MLGISKRGRLTLGSSVQKFRSRPFLGFAERRGKKKWDRQDGRRTSQRRTEKAEKNTEETDEETRGKKSN